NSTRRRVQKSRRSIDMNGKIKQKASRRGVATTPRYGADLDPTNETKCGLVPVTFRIPLTESVFCCSRNLPGNSTGTSKPETLTLPVTWIESGRGCVYVPRMLSGA